MFLVGRNPKDVASFSYHLQQQLGVNRLGILLHQGSIDYELSQNWHFLICPQSHHLEFGVGVLQVVRNDHQEHVGFVVLLQGTLYATSVVSITEILLQLEFVYSQICLQIASSLLASTH